MKKCPECGSNMKLIKGRYPWKEYYWICEVCKYSTILEDKKTPSFKDFDGNIMKWE